MNFLVRREHSQAELRRKLLQRYDSNNVIEQVLQQLVEQRLQSDARFTEIYIRMRAERGYGPVRINDELQQRGISDAIIAEFLEADDAMWFDYAKAVWKKKYGKQLPQSYHERAKQMRFLQYRGFTMAQINAVVKNAERCDRSES